MAAYFHGGNTEMETDGLHTLYLMNPNYITAQQQQSTATPQQNLFLLNSGFPHALSHSQVSHAPPSSQSQFIALPFAHPISADDPSRSGNSFHHYNLWSGGGGGGGGQVEVSGGMGAGGSQSYQIQLDNSDVFRRPAAVSPTTNQQGLSLSLSSQPGRGGGGSGNGNLYNNNTRAGGGGSTSSAVQVAVADGGADSTEVQNLIMGSKFLKAAQELLDEVVNVGKSAAATTTPSETRSVKKEKSMKMDKISNGESEAAVNNDAGGGSGGGSSRAASAELSVTQRQELQMKKTKLISMLDEVEQRYRQYHHQMKTVITTFEQVAGFGSARSYTSLALRTISKQFRCLKDAITSQIRETSRSLGEEGGEDCLGVKAEGSRLRMIDHQIRQQRALQQLGMIQHNAWRPQRGLPERAVSVLRAWLFEHFLHPYPKDSDKHILAKQTGLTRNQVSNWFINARVRLWKPMVEEMYLEEVKDQPDQKGSNQDSNSNADKQQILSTNGQQQQQQQQHLSAKTLNASPNDISNSTISTSPNASSFQQPPPGFSLIGTSSSDMNGLFQYKKARGAHETQNSPSSILSAGEISFSSRQDSLTAKFGPGYSSGHDNSNNGGGGGGGGGFGSYHHQLRDELSGRFNPDHQLTQSFHHSNNGRVSLTLGLPPGENLPHSFFSGQNMHGFDRGLQISGNGVDAEDFCGLNNNNNPQTSPHSNMGFQNMDIINRKGYAAQLLPDFVS